jgi:hypothetical protein
MHLEDVGIPAGHKSADARPTGLPGYRIQRWARTGRNRGARDHGQPRLVELRQDVLPVARSTQLRNAGAAAIVPPLLPARLPDEGITPSGRMPQQHDLSRDGVAVLAQDQQICWVAGTGRPESNLAPSVTNARVENVVNVAGHQTAGQIVIRAHALGGRLRTCRLSGQRQARCQPRYRHDKHRDPPHPGYSDGSIGTCHGDTPGAVKDGLVRS